LATADTTAAYGDVYPSRAADAHRDLDKYTYRYLDVHVDTRVANPYQYCRADSLDVDSHGNGHADCHTDGYAHRHTDGYAHFHTNGHAHRHTDVHADNHTDPHPVANGYSASDQYARSFHPPDADKWVASQSLNYCKRTQ
jgi:hypothetical protein